MPSASSAAIISKSSRTASALARYGLMIGDVQDVIATALGGETVTTTVEGRERYGVNIRYPRDLPIHPAGHRRRSPDTACQRRNDPARRCRRGRARCAARPRSAPRTANLRPTSSSTSATATSAAMSLTPRRGGAVDQIPARRLCRVERTVRISGARGSERLKVVVPVTLLHHLPAALPQLPQPDGNADRDAVAAVRAGRRLLADVVSGLQHVGGGRGRLHRARGRRGGNRRGHADLSRPRPAAR